MQDLPTKLFSLGIIGLFGTITMFWVVVPGAIHWKVTQMMRFEEGGEVYEVFQNIDAIILFKVYIFNITNAEEVASGESLPTYEEIGPYVYEEKRKNIPVKLDEESDTLTYKSTMIFKFRPELSNGSDEDVITTFNVPIVAIAHELNNWSKFIRYMAKSYITTFEEPLFVQRKVKTALFEGHHYELIESISGLMGIEYVPNNTFGYFYEKNGTITPEYVVHAGINDNSKFGQIISWRDQTEVEVWGEDNHCRMINGSDTSIYPPFLTKDSILRGFEMDICRSVFMVFQKEDEVEGIKAYRFGLSKDFFNGDTEYNQCFCTEEDRSKCPKNGALSVAACKFGAPLLMSNPHFLYGDPYYNEVTGLSPGVPEIHDSFALLEPTTGAVLKGARRAQINVVVKSSKEIAELKHVKDTVVPLVWISEEAIQSPEKINDFKWRMIIPLKVVEVSKWVFLIGSALFIVLGVVIFLVRNKDKKSVQYS